MGGCLTMLAACRRRTCRLNLKALFKTLAGVSFVSALFILVYSKTLQFQTTFSTRHNTAYFLQAQNFTGALSNVSVQQEVISDAEIKKLTTRHVTLTAEGNESSSGATTTWTSPDHVVKDHVKLPCDQVNRTFSGRVSPKQTEVSEQQLISLYPSMKAGHYTPENCIPTERLAIIIPFRDRKQHLHILLPHLIPMLIRQGIDFTIFVIEQNLPTTFNKGVVYNAGYLEALKLGDYDCFIFHDVDLLPLNDRNIYKCNPEGPVHFMAGVNKFKYRLLYAHLIGGVLGFTREQFRDVNGFSNLYFGWGSEDDDMYKRIVHKHYKVFRSPKENGLYDMIKHKRDKRWNVNRGRFNITNKAERKQEVDGLNCVTYTVTGIHVKPLYVWYNISVNMTEVYSKAPHYLKSVVENLEKEDLEHRKKEGTANEIQPNTVKS